MFEALRACLEAYDTIIIHRHRNPDGDALGSQIGLKELLRHNYPGKTVLCVGDMTPRYAFMCREPMDEVADEVYPTALAVVLDTSAKALISDDRYRLAAKSVRIDHHIFVETIADVEVTDTSYESCCGLVTQLARESDWKLTPEAATALYTGMITDSGRFRYDSTSAETFRLAAWLMEQPIPTAQIFRQLYADDFAMTRLRAQFVLKIRFTENGKVAYIYTNREEADHYAADRFTLSRGMVNVMSDIRGVDIWVNFTEAEEGVLTEIRSSVHNINPIAVAYGGGGHQKASGATLPDQATALRMLADLEAMTKEETP